MRHGVAVLGLGCVGILVALGTARGAAPADPRPALLQRAAGDTPLAKDLEDLCDHVGGRPTGSAACTRAVAWAAARFRAAGLTQVSTESFSIPLKWLPGTSLVQVVSPETFTVR